MLAWLYASGTIVEGNTFINCQREISFGLLARTAPRNDHTGGIIRNNFIYRDATVTGGDVSIGVFDSPGTQVLHNSIYSGLVSERDRSAVSEGDGRADRQQSAEQGDRPARRCAGADGAEQRGVDARSFRERAAGNMHLTAGPGGAESGTATPNGGH